MPSSLLRLALRAVACAALALAAWVWAGPWGLAPAIALAGAWLAGPLLELTADLNRGVRAHALRDIEGRHVEYRGRPLDVTEDDAGYRWIATAGLRRIVPGLPADAVLARLAPAALVQGDRRSGPRLEAEAQLALLARTSDGETHRFVRWVKREIVQPARRARGAPIGSPIGRPEPVAPPPTGRG
jgi:hypothetical protein